jgi:hypothetical protein
LVGNCVHVWSFLQYVKLVHTIWWISQDC